MTTISLVLGVEFEEC